MQFLTQVVKVLMSEATPSVSQEIVAKTNSNLRPWYDLWDYKLLSILHRKENKNQLHCGNTVLAEITLCTTHTV